MVQIFRIHVDGLGDAGSYFVRIDAEHLVVRRNGAWPHAHIEPTVREVVEERQSAGDMGGVMVLKTDRSRTDAQILGHGQHLAEEDLRHGDGLISGGMVFAHPEVDEAELVALNRQLQILVEAARQRLRRIVHGHDEDSVLQGRCRHHETPPR